MQIEQEKKKEMISVPADVYIQMVRETKKDELLTQQEVCDLLKCSRTYLWKYRKEGKIQDIRPSPNKVLFWRSSIEKFLNESK